MVALSAAAGGIDALRRGFGEVKLRLFAGSYRVTPEKADSGRRGVENALNGSLVFSASTCRR